MKLILIENVFNRIPAKLLEASLWVLDLWNTGITLDNCICKTNDRTWKNMKTEWEKLLLLILLHKNHHCHKIKI